MRTTEATISALILAAADAGEQVIVPIKLVDDIVHDLREAQRRRREYNDAVDAIEQRGAAFTSDDDGDVDTVH